MEDQSILGQKKVESYLDEFAFAICINGESIEKYKKIVEKQYGVDVYANMAQFSNTLHQQVKHGQFTKTSLLSLKYIGKNAGMSDEAIDMIVEHFNNIIKQNKEEDEYWSKCAGKDKNPLLEYLRKYPNGQYAKQAQAKIADLERIEKEAIEESRMFNQCNTQRDYMNFLVKFPNGAYAAKAQAKIAKIEKEQKNKQEEETFWKQCNQNDKQQLNQYLKKYPKGMYASRAKSLISELERIEKEAIEESRMFNQCHTQRDYMNFLVKFPNGAYAAKAKLRLEELERQGRKEMEENRVYNLCKTKTDYQEYLKKYPDGKFAYEAKSKIWDLEQKEKEISRREEDVFWSQCNNTNKDSLQRYLNKYPNGIYASQAKSLIADIETKEKEAVEESRMYEQCRSKNDYMEYLRKYPNGHYKNQAQERIKELKHTSQLKYIKIILGLLCGVLAVVAALFFFSNDSVEVSEPTGMAEGHGWVDLGLPSGLKWATCNIGASVPSELGDEFAWGETEIKAEYTQESYKFRLEGDTGTVIKFNKYNTDNDWGIVDNKKHLDECDDAAHIKWGGNWKIPTAEDINELLDNCTFELGSLNGIKGCKVTSKINGNSIFLPTLGNTFINWYWSSSLGSSFDQNAYVLHIFNNKHELMTSYRWKNSPIRAVLEEDHYREMTNTVKNDSFTDKKVAESSADTTSLSVVTENDYIYSEEEVEEKPFLSYGSYKSDEAMNDHRHYIAFDEYFKNNSPETDDLDYNADFYAHFIVEKDGSMTNISVTYYNRESGSTSGHDDYCKELAESLKNNKRELKWEPGKKNGKPVRVKVSTLIMQWG